MYLLNLPAGQEEMLPPVRVAGDNSQSIAPMTLTEATQDRTIMRLTRQLIEAVERETFQPGPVEVD